jgi:hypothetical protein
LLLLAFLPDLREGFSIPSTSWSVISAKEARLPRDVCGQYVVKVATFTDKLCKMIHSGFPKHDVSLGANPRMQLILQRDSRVAEGARLETVYAGLAAPGGNKSTFIQVRVSPALADDSENCWAKIRLAVGWTDGGTVGGGIPHGNVDRDGIEKTQRQRASSLRHSLRQCREHSMLPGMMRHENK